MHNCPHSSSPSHQQFGKLLDAVKGPVLVIGSATADVRRERANNLLLGRFGNHPLLDLGLTMEGLPRMDDRGRGEVASKSLRMLSRLLPNRVVVSPPNDEASLKDWKTMLESDIATMRERSNRVAIRSLLGRCGMDCPDLDQVVVRDQALGSEAVEKTVGWAMAHSLMHTEECQAVVDRYVIKVRQLWQFDADRIDEPSQAASFNVAVEQFRTVQAEGQPGKSSLKDVQTDNEFEKRLLGEVIPAKDVGVSFDDIGALDGVKRTLREVWWRRLSNGARPCQCSSCTAPHRLSCFHCSDPSCSPRVT